MNHEQNHLQNGQFALAIAMPGEDTKNT